MFRLRQTWSDVFPPKKLYALDVRVKSIDPAWPITAPAPTSIHLNPAFLPKVGVSMYFITFSLSCGPLRLLHLDPILLFCLHFLFCRHLSFIAELCLNLVCHFRFVYLKNEDRPGYKPNSTKKVTTVASVVGDALELKAHCLT